jgi:hypothetical protein
MVKALRLKRTGGYRTRSSRPHVSFVSAVASLIEAENPTGRPRPVVRRSNETAERLPDPSQQPRFKSPTPVILRDFFVSEMSPLVRKTFECREPRGFRL